MFVEEMVNNAWMLAGSCFSFDEKEQTHAEAADILTLFPVHLLRYFFMCSVWLFAAVP